MGVANIARRSVIPAIKALPEQFELVAIASRSAEKAAAAGREFGCDAVVGYANLLAVHDVDALYVPLPTGLHQEWVNAALAAGKHLYVEKSIAANFPDAEAMVANASQSNRALMEGFMFQYHSQHRIVFELLENGAIGKLRHFAASFGFPPLAASDFRYDRAVGGGALLDAGGYTVRATHFLLGDRMRVRGATLHVDPERQVDTYGSAFLADESGLGASVAFGFDQSYQCRYELWGSAGKITATRAFTPGPTSRPQIIVETAAGAKVVDAEPDNHFINALLEFKRAIDAVEIRQKHYRDILLQSSTLEAIRTLGTP